MLRLGSAIFSRRFLRSRNQAVSEQIVTHRSRHKIKCSRSGRDEDDAALFIDSHPSPIIRRAAGFLERRLARCYDDSPSYGIV